MSEYDYEDDDYYREQVYESEYSSDGYSSEDERHILKINLNSSTTDQVIQAAKRTTTANFQGRLDKQEDLTIVASTLSTGQGDADIRIITRQKFHDEAESDGKSHDRWK